MDSFIESFSDHFRQCLEYVSERTSIDEERIFFLVIVVVLFIVWVTFLIIRGIYKSYSHKMSISEEEKRIQEKKERSAARHNATHYDSERINQLRSLSGDNPPQSDQSSPLNVEITREEEVSDVSENEKTTPISSSENELCTEGTPALPLPNDSSNESGSSVNLAEPGIIILYKTRKKETFSVRKGVIEELIREKIDETILSAATVGMTYDCTFDLSSKDLNDQFGGIVIEKINISTKLESLGLVCQMIKEQDTEKITSIRLSGTPTAVFDGKFYFFLVHTAYTKDLPEGEKSDVKDEITSFTLYPKEYVHSKPFVINPDPRSLWKDLPVEDYEGYENKDCDCRGETIPGTNVEVLAASCRGRSHAHAAKPRDDCFHFEFDETTGWNFVAVADGAGSAKFSRKGSELACHTVIKSLREKLTPQANDVILKKKAILERWKETFVQCKGKTDRSWEDEFVEATEFDKIFHHAVYGAYMAIVQEAERRGASPKDYHTTLLCAAFRYIEELNTYFVVSYWVGDGGAALFADNSNSTSWQRILVLGEPDGGEFAGQTRFLTMKDEIDAGAIRKRLRFSFCEKMYAMLLVTDGITDPFFPSEAAVVDEARWREFYDQKLKRGCEEESNGCPKLDSSKFSPQEKAESLLKWLEFWSKGNHDDRTILIVKPQRNP